jgi:hypothetical protein
LEVEQAFSEKVMSFWGNFARTGYLILFLFVVIIVGNSFSEPVEYWPKYNRITRKSLVISEEIAKGNSHRIYVDVHGKL